jgi:hypothetical protein
MKYGNTPGNLFGKRQGQKKFLGNSLIHQFQKIVIGEKAICPVIRPAISATSERVSAPAERNAFMMYCSVWLLTGSV